MSRELHSRLARFAPWCLALAGALVVAFAAHAQMEGATRTAAAVFAAPAPASAAAPPRAPSSAAASASASASLSGADAGPAAEPTPSDEQIEAAIDQAEVTSGLDATDGGTLPAAEVKEVPAAAANAAAQTAPLPGLALLRKAKLSGTGDGAFYSATMDDGRVARLTLDPHLQTQMQKLLLDYKPMDAAIVAIDPKTGRLLAMAEFAQDGKAEGLATRPLYPAASVFKIITGAALLEKGVSPDTETCFHGGMHGIVGALLKDTRLDRRCLSLSMALAKSANVVFAKMAMKHLDAKALRTEAEQFLFNRPIWDDKAAPASTAQIPEEKLEFAKSAAGFGQVRLSPLHAAMIAAAVSSGGVAQSPTLIEDIDGRQQPAGRPRKLLQKATADTLRDMMKLTVSQGTAHSSFRERSGNVLGPIEVAGKTGSLSSHEKPFKDYSWFVGFAPADDPQIAVAVVVVNGLKWRIHAPYVAREALRAYLVGGAIGQPPVAKRPPRRRKHR